jgi:hypothetical protein
MVQTLAARQSAQNGAIGSSCTTRQVCCYQLTFSQCLSSPSKGTRHWQAKVTCQVDSQVYLCSEQESM